MLENHSSTVTAAAGSSVKRYAPPHQKNRTHNRRKSGERIERTNYFGLTDGERNQVPGPRSIADAGSSNLLNENSRPVLIALDGCSNSEASQLLSNRWAAAMHSYNNPSLDVSEKPVLYSGNSVPVWGHFRLPHQLIPPSAAPSSGSHIDFPGQHRSRSVYTAPSK